MKSAKVLKRKRRQVRVKAKISSRNPRPQLIVTRSNTAITGQIVCPNSGKTVISVTDLKSRGKKTKVESAKEVGVEIAKLATKEGITEITFNRNGYIYHGRVKALAEGAREGGLKF